MEFMLLMIDDRDREATPQEMGALMGKMGQWAGKLGAEGRIRGGAPLKSISEAARVRHQDGQPLVTDGPFAETKEVMAGYFVVEADSREQAIELARDCPHLGIGIVEVREVIPVGDPPAPV